MQTSITLSVFKSYTPNVNRHRRSDNILVFITPEKVYLFITV